MARVAAGCCEESRWDKPPPARWWRLRGAGSGTIERRTYQDGSQSWGSECGCGEGAVSPACGRQHWAEVSSHRGRVTVPLTQPCVSAPSPAGAARILHPQPLLHHVPVCAGVAHPGAECPSTFLSLLEVSLPGTGWSFLVSAWAACPRDDVSQITSHQGSSSHLFPWENLSPAPASRAALRQQVQ